MVINKRLFLCLFFFFLKSVPLGQLRFFLMSQSDDRASVLIVKVFCSYFTTGLFFGFICLFGFWVLFFN